MEKHATITITHKTWTRTIPKPTDWPSWSTKEQSTYPKYYMAAETLYDLQQATAQYPPTDSRHDQIIIWVMAIIKSRQSGLRNRGVALNETDQLADGYAQMIPSLLSHRSAEIEREVQVANEMLDQIEPTLVGAQRYIDADHLRFLEMRSDERAERCPASSGESQFEDLHAASVECSRIRVDDILDALSSLGIEAKRLKEAEKVIFRRS